MKQPRIFIGPMNQFVIDSVIDFTERNNVSLGLIPSRRQIETASLGSGYVNNWSTKEFCEYVKKRSNKVILVRDHGGPHQGNKDDDGYESLKEDCKYFDVIHIDVWKKYKKLEDGIKATADYIEFCYKENPNLFFEIGTEEAIRKFEVNELIKLLETLDLMLDEKIFLRIKYLVIQSGTALKETENIGSYNQERLINMISLAKEWNLISKEHNGDFLKNEIIESKFKNGLDSINIAPEFGQISTNIILETIKEKEELFNKLYDICLNSKRWVKWVGNDFNPDDNKETLIKICGHYVFSEPKFIEILNEIGDHSNIIKDKINNRLKELIFLTNEK